MIYSEVQDADRYFKKGIPNTEYLNKELVLMVPHNIIVTLCPKDYSFILNTDKSMECKTHPC